MVDVNSLFILFTGNGVQLQDPTDDEASQPAVIKTASREPWIHVRYGTVHVNIKFTTHTECNFFNVTFLMKTKFWVRMYISC